MLNTTPLRRALAQAVRTPAALLTLAAITALGSHAAAQSPNAAMFRYPAISDSKIAFVYANQIWTAPRTGGTASPMAAPPGQASNPRFSPDGATLAFSANYDGNRDLYTVPLTGGAPFRVTHHPADESLCGWTEDGKLVFFARALSGNSIIRTNQLFTVPAAGGLPEKLPMPYSGYGAISRDGQWVAFTPTSIDTRTWKRYRGGMATDLWLLNLKTGESRKITDWEGSDTLPMWGYGRAQDTVYYLCDAGPEHRLNIWAFNLTSGDRQQITRFDADDVRWPSIGPGSIEDRGRTPGEIIFQLGAKLMVLDLATKQSREVSITVPGAKPKLRESFKDAADNISAADLSPSGKRVLLTARGDIFSLPAKEGPMRNLTHTPGIFERDASWSPDGKYIAYFSDASGEYELYIRPSDARAAAEEDKKDGKKDDDAKKDEGKKDESAKPENARGDEPRPAGATPAIKEPVKLTDLGPGFRYNPIWSPDSKHIAFTDKAGALVLVSLTFDGGGDGSVKSDVKTIDVDPQDNQPEISWSHDSAWLAYIRGDESSKLPAVWLYKVADGSKTRITTPMFGCNSPAFDRKGEFLYYVIQNEISSPMYSDIDNSFVYTGTQRLVALPLRTDVKHPYASRSDEEELKKDDKKKDDQKKPAKSDGKKDEPAKDGDKKDDAKADDKDAKPPEDKKADDKKPEETKAEEKKPEEKKPEEKKDDKAIKIDLDGIEQRSFLLPPGPGNFGALQVTDEGKLMYVRRGSRGQSERPSIKLFDPKDDKKEEQTVVAEVGGYALSANGKKILVQKAGRRQILDAVSGGGKAQDVSTAGMRLTVDPRTEWKQIFTDSWRLMRDFFYVPNMHGVDWPKMREHYGAMIDDCATREDVNWVISEMISELNIGHAYLGNPGDIDNAPNLGVGLLGCDFELVPGENGGGAAAAYRIKAIFQGAPWEPDARNPLVNATPVAPGKERPKVGDYLLAVNGVPLNVAEDPWAAFIGLADKPTTITFNDKPTMEGAHEALVTPVASDANLRFRSWIERNRAYVEAKTDGKVGYVYVPDTGQPGQNELFRQFYGQLGKAGLIIDERWNGGGQIPTRFIELLNRPVTNYWAKRDGQDWTWPPDSHQGAKCMLINGNSGSGGDMFPWLFKHNKLGKVFGQRTWGGLVGISGNPAFIDGGTITVPTFGFYETDGTWGVEGHGIDPDVPVLDDPGRMTDTIAAKADGHVADPQLDAAIAHMVEEIAARPYTPPKRPAAPDRSGMGLPEADR